MISIYCKSILNCFYKKKNILSKKSIHT